MAEIVIDVDSLPKVSRIDAHRLKVDGMPGPLAITAKQDESWYQSRALAHLAVSYFLVAERAELRDAEEREVEVLAQQLYDAAFEDLDHSWDDASEPTRETWRKVARRAKELQS